MRLHTSSTGLDPRSLEPGTDLVLRLDEAHGDAARESVLAHDHLDSDARRAVDDAVKPSLAAWRCEFDDALTIDGLCLSWAWEFAFVDEGWLLTIRDAAGLAAALETYAPPAIELADSDPHTERVARAAADARGIPVRRAPDASAPRSEPRPTRAPFSRRAIAAASRVGLPSLVRHDSVVVRSYWHMMPLFDAMLADRSLRPGIFFTSRPAGARRSAAALARGGLIGTPGPRTRARARRQASQLLASIAEPPDLEVLGMPLGPALHARAVAAVRRRAADDLAFAAVVRRAFARGRARGVVLPSDEDPPGRIVTALARDAGIASVAIQHGAVILPRPIVEGEVADVYAIWSAAVAPPLDRFPRSFRVVGYPVTHEPPPTRRIEGAAPQVVVLGQGEDEHTAMMDARHRLRHYVAAVDAITSAAPRARVVLRPHHWDPDAPLQAVVERFPDADVVVDRSSDIHDLLRQSDLCVGASTTATYQAALVGTPVVVLNVGCFEWPWPLDGAGSLPVARSRDELAAQLEPWARGEVLPGRDELLLALGVTEDDVTARLLELIAAAGSSTPAREPRAGVPVRPALARQRET